MKKVIQWYNLLQANDLLETAEAPSETANADEEE